MFILIACFPQRSHLGRRARASASHQWFSGKISRCHRGAPGSIPGWCNDALVIPFPFVREKTSLLCHMKMYSPMQNENILSCANGGMKEFIFQNLPQFYGTSFGRDTSKRHWSNGQDLRLPSEGSGFNSPVAQTFSSVTSCAFTAVMGIISHAFCSLELNV